jgi:hypothetical protein
VLILTTEEDVMLSRRLSGAMVVALVALFFSLGGAAVAAGIVPLAKRALVADNAKKLAGKTPAQLQPGSIAALISVRTANWSLSPAQANTFTAACASTEKVVGGGYDHTSGDVLAFDARPASDGHGWQVNLESLSPTSSAAGTVYAICAR